MLQSCETERKELKPLLLLSGRETEVAKANVKFALDNCPVDGGLPTEDGCALSRETVEALLTKLEAGGDAPSLTEEELKLLQTIAGFTLEYCPYEGGLTLDDGGVASATDMTALRERTTAILQQQVAAQE